MRLRERASAILAADHRFRCESPACEIFRSWSILRLTDPTLVGSDQHWLGRNIPI
jgi:hypothetical protein